MDQDVDGDGAINLSTSQRPSAATTPNEGIQSEDVEQVSLSNQPLTELNRYTNTRKKKKILKSTL